MAIFSRYKDIPRYVTTLSRSNRNCPTEQEEKLWTKLSTRKLNNVKFRRQFPIGRYIVDFYDHAHKLIVEIDGDIHNVKKEYDKNRDSYLKECGFKVLHFTNNEIDFDIESVLKNNMSVFKKSPCGGFRGRVLMKIVISNVYLYQMQFRVRKRMRVMDNTIYDCLSENELLSMLKRCI